MDSNWNPNYVLDENHFGHVFNHSFGACLRFAKESWDEFRRLFWGTNPLARYSYPFPPGLIQRLQRLYKYMMDQVHRYENEPGEGGIAKNALEQSHMLAPAFNRTAAQTQRWRVTRYGVGDLAQGPHLSFQLIFMQIFCALFASHNGGQINIMNRQQEGKPLHRTMVVASKEWVVLPHIPMHPVQPPEAPRRSKRSDV